METKIKRSVNGIKFSKVLKIKNKPKTTDLTCDYYLNKTYSNKNNTNICQNGVINLDPSSAKKVTNGFIKVSTESVEKTLEENQILSADLDRSEKCIGNVLDVEILEGKGTKREEKFAENPLDLEENKRELKHTQSFENLLTPHLLDENIRKINEEIDTFEITPISVDKTAGNLHTSTKNVHKNAENLGSTTVNLYKYEENFETIAESFDENAQNFENNIENLNKNAENFDVIADNLENTADSTLIFNTPDYTKVYDTFSRAFSRQNSQFEKAIRSLSSLSSQFTEIVSPVSKKFRYDQRNTEADLNLIQDQQSKFVLVPCVEILKELILDAQEKFSRMVEENQELAARIDAELQVAQLGVNCLRSDLIDTNKVLAKMQKQDKLESDLNDNSKGKENPSFSPDSEVHTTLLQENPVNLRNSSITCRDRREDNRRNSAKIRETFKSSRLKTDKENFKKDKNAEKIQPICNGTVNGTQDECHARLNDPSNSLDHVIVSTNSHKSKNNVTTHGISSSSKTQNDAKNSTYRPPSTYKSQNEVIDHITEPQSYKAQNGTKYSFDSKSDSFESNSEKGSQNDALQNNFSAKRALQFNKHSKEEGGGHLHNANYGQDNLNEAMSVKLRKIREENNSLKDKNESLEQEIYELKYLKSVIMSSNEYSAPSSPNDSNSAFEAVRIKCDPKMTQMAVQLTHAKDALTALKVDRKRLKTEKLDLLNQMKQLYATIDEKEHEIRHFIRTYEQRMKASEDSLRDANRAREESEREKYNLMKKARNDVEKTARLTEQLNEKDAQFQIIKDELELVRKQISALSELDASIHSAKLNPQISSPSNLSPNQNPTPNLSPIPLSSNSFSHSLSASPPASSSPLPILANGGMNGRGSSADSGVRLSSDRESASESHEVPSIPTAVERPRNIDSDVASLCSSNATGASSHYYYYYHNYGSGTPSRDSSNIYATPVYVPDVNNPRNRNSMVEMTSKMRAQCSENVNSKFRSQKYSEADHRHRMHDLNATLRYTDPSSKTQSFDYDSDHRQISNDFGLPATNNDKSWIERNVFSKSFDKTSTLKPASVYSKTDLLKQFSSPKGLSMTISRKSNKSAAGGTWGSISRVFNRPKKRASLAASLSQDDSLNDKRSSWSPGINPPSSPLSEQSYSEKLCLLHEAQHIPLERWKATTVLAWIEITLGMPQYGTQIAENVRSGKVLCELNDTEIESGLGITHPMHKKKLRLAIEELRDPSKRKFPKISSLDHTWVSSEWLPDLGLPQYTESFANNLVDGRVLEALSKKELEKYLGVSRKFHQASLVNGIRLLRIFRFDRQLLAEKRRQCEKIDADPIVWTNQRCMQWARSIDLHEYGDNLKGSGVHGALIVLEQSFSAETMATALGIPNSKSIIRRHLAAEFDGLILHARRQLEEQARIAKMEKRRQEKLGGGSLGRSFGLNFGGTIDRKDPTNKRSSLRGSLSKALGLKTKGTEESIYETGADISNLKNSLVHALNNSKFSSVREPLMPIRKEIKAKPREVIYENLDKKFLNRNVTERPHSARYYIGANSLDNSQTDNFLTSNFPGISRDNQYLAANGLEKSRNIGERPKSSVVPLSVAAKFAEGEGHRRVRSISDIEYVKTVTPV